MFMKNKGYMFRLKPLAIIRPNYKNTKGAHILQLYFRFEISKFAT